MSDFWKLLWVVAIVQVVFSPNLLFLLVSVVLIGICVGIFEAVVDHRQRCGTKEGTQ